MTGETQRRDWNDMAAIDPMWAVLSHRGKKHERWDEAEFLASGSAQIDELLRSAERLGVPTRRDRVLDFGCGLGRLAPGLAGRFLEYLGVDVSSEMVQQAQHIHAGRPNCRFRVVTDPAHLDVDDASMDLVVSFFVLQHVDDTAIVQAALDAMARALAPGGLLVVQLPSSVHPVMRAVHAIRRAGYRTLRRAGVRPDAVYRRLGLAPMSMRARREAQVTGRLEAGGLRVLRVERGHMGRAVANRVYFATRDVLPR